MNQKIMKKVTCINDKNLPTGAYLVKDDEYTVVDEFINNYGQKVYLLMETTNKGRTKLGMEWYGYDATRFATVTKEKAEIEEFNYAMN